MRFALDTVFSVFMLSSIAIVQSHENLYVRDMDNHLAARDVLTKLDAIKVGSYKLFFFLET